MKVVALSLTAVFLTSIKLAVVAPEGSGGYTDVPESCTDCNITCFGFLPNQSIYWAIGDQRIGMCFQGNNTCTNTSTDYELSRPRDTQSDLRIKSICREKDGTILKCSRVNNASSANCTINVIYGPSTANISYHTPLLANEPGTILCQVRAEDVHPSANFTWIGVACANTNESHSGTQSICGFTPTQGDNGRNVTCTATNTRAQDLQATVTRTIEVYYPPPSAPEITGYREGQLLTAGSQVSLTCTVHGGNPVAGSVTFYCERIHLPRQVSESTQRSDAASEECCERYDDEEDVHVAADAESGSAARVSSSLRIDISVEDNGTTCHCSANWTVRPEQYLQTASVSLTVIEAEAETKGDKSLPVAIVAGGAAAVAVVIVSVIIVAVIIRKKRRSANEQQKEANRNSGEGDFEEHVNPVYEIGDETTESSGTKHLLGPAGDVYAVVDKPPTPRQDKVLKGPTSNEDTKKQTKHGNTGPDKGTNGDTSSNPDSHDQQLSDVEKGYENVNQTLAKDSPSALGESEDEYNRLNISESQPHHNVSSPEYSHMGEH